MEDAPELEEEDTFVEDWRLNWIALARAFSWVRTKLARFYQISTNADNGIRLDQP